ncbi:phosphate ABC transporter permease subunit PstC [Clostridium botulinum]|uniref:Phosphate transport system permease protein n=2 Tax=Clostridium botulinum TaxID=1491 RepID=C1FSU7_CLOBJ|nr:phosphate ABC transporter permease subunit PstC [Clostridium botulinum]ACO84688.1 phosphate ABC transporter, permease protein PstC [Clostridium botulinum A2 str. Kyoto]APH24372.1 phosphate ABC transporter, permease protein PstC [Clostridium botulinum]APQ67340.1 phosphate ABC transporter, permease protein PstC [Clostridium botulinum]AUN07673.1 phosphate ABC transporter permease subunit PstC [Clostridium botulinum]EPS55741.1 phosphate ABC transporter permease [Clostridium botulinum Af84]
MHISNRKISSKEISKRKLLKNLRNEYIGRGLSTICGVLIVFLTLSIIFFVALKGITVFSKGVSLKEFLFSTNWSPDNDVPRFGALNFIAGSTFVSIGAVILSAPVSIALAIFINYISPKLGDKVLKPALELFVGIPSVVYGWLGISILLPIIKRIYGGTGFSILAGIIVLSIMILPTIASISVDAIKVVPKSYLQASYGLGATRWQTISNVIVPSAKDGILTGIILGLARAFGEALAVQMVIGNSIQFPNKLLNPASTLTSVITMDMANTIGGTVWNDALWALALLLLIISFLFIIAIRIISRRRED